MKQPLIITFLLSVLLLFACNTQPAVVVVVTATPMPITATPMVEPSAIPTATPLPAPPVFGPITFATSIDPTTNQPIEPANQFESGVSLIYAVFEYQNLTPHDQWERVWFLNDEEMLRSQENWSDSANGLYPYFLDSGGPALPPGEWHLIISLNDEPATEAIFTIIAPPTATPTKTPKATATLKPTKTPKATAVTSTPTAQTNTARPVSTRNYQIAYGFWTGSYHDLYLADTNGDNITFLIQRGTGPTWSGDGSQLFFFGEQGVNQQFRNGAIGCEFGTISGGLVGIDLPTPLQDICNVQGGIWACERRDDARDVCSANGIHVYQNLEWKEGTARWVSVSPDGGQFVYDAKPSGTYRLYFQNLTSYQRTPFELLGEQGSWSPNSQRLVYRSGRDNKAGLWISNRDDTGHLLVTKSGTDAFPSWSPNGQTIAFTRDNGGNTDIYTMNIDGSNIQRLTEANGPDTLPTFTPDGQQIIFRSARNGSWGIWKMNYDGSNQQEIIAKVGLADDWAYGRIAIR